MKVVGHEERLSPFKNEGSQKPLRIHIEKTGDDAS